MTDGEFQALCERVLRSIEDGLDRCGADVETSRQGPVLELEFDDGSKMVVNGNAPLIGGSASWTYNLGGPAATTELRVTDTNGKTVFNATGEMGAGNHSFVWNGKDNGGNQLSDGAYKLTVTATDAAGGKIDSNVASAATVTQIDMTGSAPRLIIGTMEIDLADIAAIAN